jgi:streptogramin lyase
MTSRSWIRRLFPRTPRTVRKAPPRIRLHLEALEGRLVPTNVTLVPVPNQSNGEGLAVSLPVTASGDLLTYSATGLPQGLSIDGSTGRISGTVSVGAAQHAPSVTPISGITSTYDGFLGHYTATVTARSGRDRAISTFDWAIYGITNVHGEHYDVDGDATNGPELLHTPDNNHFHDAAHFLGVADENHANIIQGALYSDSRIHANPAVLGFDTSTGSAPDWYSIDVVSSPSRVNWVLARVTTWGGSSSSLFQYRLTVFTDRIPEGRTTAVSGNGTATVDTGSNAYSDGSQIYFEIQKVSPLSIREAVGYTVTFDVHGNPLPADPTFTKTVVTSSEKAWFYGHPETFTAQVSNASPGGGAVPTGAAQFQIDGGNFGQPVTLDANGRATLTTTTLGPGVHTVHAVYTDTTHRFQGSSGDLAGVVTVTSWVPKLVTSTDAANPDVAGTAFNVTVVARDPFGDPDTSYTGTVHFSSTDPTATLPADYTFTAADNGRHTFSSVVLRRAGGQTITASAGPIGSATEFTIPTANSQPYGITAGPDGNLWFTEGNSSKVGKITPAGGVTEFSIPPGFDHQLYGITAGIDGNLWFTDLSNFVGKITPAGAVAEWYILTTPDCLPYGIAAGPDGNLWFTEGGGNNVGRITPAGVWHEFPIPTSGSMPYGITAGSDGNLWFVESSGDKVGKITPAGVVTEFPIPTANSQPHGIAAGPDGNLWFVETNANQVGKITPDGIVTEFPIPTANSQPYGITAGPDGNLWFAEVGGNKAGKITPAGVVTEFSIPTANSQPFGIMAGPDGNLWLTERSGNKIGRITSGGPYESAAVSVVAAAADHYDVTAPAGIVAGTPFNVTVAAQDRYGNTAAGYRGTDHFTSSDPAATLPADYAFTAADNGTHIFSGVILRTARFPLVTTITATDTVTGSITGSTGVRVMAAPATHFVLSTSAANPDIAGTPFDVTVTAQDPYGNTDTGYLGTVHFSSADPYGASLPADFSFRNVDQGFHRFPRGATLYTAGTWDVTATDTQSSITGSANVNVIAAAASQFVVSTDTANPDIAGTVFDVTVVATDPYGNTDTHYQGTVTFSSADPYGATLPPNYTFQASDQGVATFSGVTALYTAGTWDVTATDTQSGITGAARVSVQAAPAVALQVVAPAGATSGVAFDVTVIAEDLYGNTDMNYTGTIHFTTSDMDPGVMLPPDYAFQASDAGMVTFAAGVTLITLGDQSLTATDTTSGITGTATVTVTSGAAYGTGGFGANPALWQQPQSSAVPAGPTSPSATSRDEESAPVRAQLVGAAAHRAVLIDHVWSDPADLLLDGLWTRF